MPGADCRLSGKEAMKIKDLTLSQWFVIVFVLVPLAIILGLKDTFAPKFINLLDKIEDKALSKIK